MNYIKKISLFFLFSLVITTSIENSNNYIFTDTSAQNCLSIPRGYNLPNLTDPDNADDKNPTRKQIFATMCDVGSKYNIPPEILYAVAFAESGLKQFYPNGKPFISFDNGIGLMQVTPGRAPVKFDIKKLKYDYKYNIQIGAKILLAKWQEQEEIVKRNGKKGHHLPIVGNKNPMILENWYFVLWAYNGYAGENNPNMLPMFIRKLRETKKRAYQDRVIELAEEHLQIKITKFPKESLPKESLPEVGLTYKTPEPFHYSLLSPQNLDVNTRYKVAKTLNDNINLGFLVD